MKFFLEAEVPESEARNFLQHIRDFDTNNPSCHFKIIGVMPNLTTEQAAKLMDIHPKLEVTIINNIDKDQE